MSAKFKNGISVNGGLSVNYRSLTTNNDSLTANDYFVEINTRSLAITTATASGGNITYTTATPHGFVAGANPDRIIVGGFTTSTAFNSTITSGAPVALTVTSATTYTFTVTKTASGTAAMAGTPKVYSIVDNIYLPLPASVSVGQIYEIRVNQYISVTGGKTSPPVQKIYQGSVGSGTAISVGGFSNMTTNKIISTGTTWRILGAWGGGSASSGTS